MKGIIDLCGGNKIHQDCCLQFVNTTVLWTAVTGKCFFHLSLCPVAWDCDRILRWPEL